MMLGFGLILVNICVESVYKVPFSSPVSPLSWKGMRRDVLTRIGWQRMAQGSSKVQDMPGSDVTLRGEEDKKS